MMTGNNASVSTTSVVSASNRSNRHSAENVASDGSSNLTIEQLEAPDYIGNRTAISMHYFSYAVLIIAIGFIIFLWIGHRRYEKKTMKRELRRKSIMSIRSTILNEISDIIRSNSMTVAGVDEGDYAREEGGIGTPEIWIQDEGETLPRPLFINGRTSIVINNVDTTQKHINLSSEMSGRRMLNGHRHSSTDI